VRKNSLLYTAFALVVILGVLHFIAKAFYFYWTIWWFDNMIHFLAGFAGGLIALWFLFDSNIFYRRFPKTFESISNALASVMVFGIAWEIFEYANDITQATEGYVPDTFHDFFFDALGAVLAGLVGARRSLHAKN